jgi:hypothetical protein
LLQEDEATFVKVFKKPTPSTLPQTWGLAHNVRDHDDHKRTRKLPNNIKHQWTGSLIRHLPTPADIRRDFGANPNQTYAAYGVRLVNDSDLEEVCRTAQRSLNLLVDLAHTLDKEIGWERYFELTGHCEVQEGDSHQNGSS